MTACGMEVTCEWCNKRNSCNRRGYNPDTGEREHYFPDLWAIFHEEEREKTRDEHLIDGWWKY